MVGKVFGIPTHGSFKTSSCCMCKILGVISNRLSFVVVGEKSEHDSLCTRAVNSWGRGGGISTRILHPIVQTRL